MPNPEGTMPNLAENQEHVPLAPEDYSQDQGYPDSISEEALATEAVVSTIDSSLQKIASKKSAEGFSRLESLGDGSNSTANTRYNNIAQRDNTSGGRFVRQPKSE